MFIIAVFIGRGTHLTELLWFLTDERYSENDLVCLTNQGDIEIFTLPQLRRQLKEACIRKENVR